LKRFHTEGFTEYALYSVSNSVIWKQNHYLHLLLNFENVTRFSLSLLLGGVTSKGMYSESIF